VIGSIAFGANFDVVGSEGKDTKATLSAVENTLLPVVLKRIITPPVLWAFMGIGPTSTGTVTARKTLYDVMKAVRQKRQDMDQYSPTSITDQLPMNVMDRLLSQTETDKMNEDEMWGEMIAFFLAGHETTANTLNFTIYELCEHPEIQEQLFEEVKSVPLDKKIGEVVPKLKLLDHVMKETQRRHSIVGAVNRVTSKDVELLGYVIPKGIQVTINIRAIHRSPEYYDDPDAFKPDRWDGEKRKPSAFLPFSDGPHNCIGRKMAEIEYKVILLALLQKYKFVKHPDSVLELSTAITHRLKGLYVNIIQRE